MRKVRILRSLVTTLAGLSLVAATGCAGCFGGGAAEEEATTTTGRNVDGPLSALAALSDLASNAESLQAEIAEMEPVDPVHFSVLMDALPDGFDDWTAGEARGETNQMGQFAMSMASNQYRRDDGGEIDVAISDFAFNQIAYSSFALAAAFSQESSEGYNRGITVGEDPGREEFDYESQSGSREVIYGKRYHIKVEGRGVGPEDLEAWYTRAKTDGLPLE